MSDSRTSKPSLTPDDLAADINELALSSYNPVALGHLRQPVPRDLPPNLNSSVFTFQDAFEDLLTVSQGNQLPDINSRYQQSRLLRQMYPNGEPSWLWIRRLESQGLIRRPQRSIILSSAEQNWREFQSGIEESAEEIWRNVRGVADHPKNREAAAEVGKVFRALRDQFSGAANESSAGSHDKSQDNSEPDNFDELYSAMRSAYSDGQGAWKAFKKAMNEDVPRRIDDFERRIEEIITNSKPSTSTQVNPKENENETKSEYVDVFGYKHTTIQRKKYDENGKEISSSTSVFIRPAETDESNALETSDGKPDTSEADGKHKKGWFW